MKTIVAAISAILLSSFSVAMASLAEIAIDGEFDDWALVTWGKIKDVCK